MSKEMDSDFGERLRRAAEHAKVPFTPQSIASLIRTDRRKAAVWLDGGLPRADTLYALADKLGVDARWFATGKGDMLAKPATPEGLPADEEELLDRYREAEPRWRLSLQLLAALATEEQLEAAPDVNIIMARVFRKRPEELRPVGNRRMREVLKKSPEGWPPRAPVKKT